jgi:hypothetical protein
MENKILESYILDIASFIYNRTLPLAVTAVNKSHAAKIVRLK